MIPFIQNYRKCTLIYSDQWLPEMEVGGREGVAFGNDR